jgi:hypothetical protein
MRNALSAVCLGAVVFGLTGCATPYQKSGFTGGYTDKHLRDDLYFVEFAGNGVISRAQVAEYFYRRAREVCTENGYSDYRVVDPKDNSVQSFYGSNNGIVSVATINKPVMSGFVNCLR